MTTTQNPRESTRLRRVHLPDRVELIGMSGRDADLQLRLDGAGHGLLDATHFDTVRFPPPDWAIPTFVAAASDGELAYTSYRGSFDALTTCARSASALLGVDLDPERHVAFTTGTQGGLFCVLSALVDEGDVVVLADPEYLFVEKMLRFLGATVERLPLIDTGDAYGPQPDLERLDQLASQGIKLFLTSNPNNPTGSVFTPQTIRRLAELAQQHDFLTVVDELYCRLVYGDTQFTHLAAEPGMAERTVTLLGGSKTESLSGFRVGLLTGPASVIDAVEQVIAMCSLRAPAYAQQVMTRWLVDDVDFVAERVVELAALREMTVEALRRIPGVTLTPGAGTAYVWPDLSALGLSDVEVARILQREAGLVVSPGYQFGPSGIGRMRLCYAREENGWQQTLDRIVTSLTRVAEERTS